MNYRPILLIFALLPGLLVHAGSDTLPGPNWDRASAIAIADTADSRETLALLYRLAREGRSRELLLQVRTIADDTRRPGPERDLILHSLATALGDFEPDMVDPGVLEYLSQTRSRARVAHEEHPRMGVPLYNIRAAASGSLMKWESFEDRASGGPDTEVYSDADAFAKAISGPKGPELAGLVRKARLTLDSEELETIVLSAPSMPDAGAASVVLAELSPDLLGRPAIDDLLFELLGHPELGASAALVLGRHGDGLVLDRLAGLASRDEGLASRRASLAIDTHLAVRKGR